MWLPEMAGERRPHGPDERIGLLTGAGQVLPRRYARPVADRTHRGRSAPVRDRLAVPAPAELIGWMHEY
jgi:hypothetical protein